MPNSRCPPKKNVKIYSKNNTSSGRLPGGSRCQGLPVTDAVNVRGAATVHGPGPRSFFPLTLVFLPSATSTHSSRRYSRTLSTVGSASIPFLPHQVRHTASLPSTRRRSPRWRTARRLELATPPMRLQQWDCEVVAACVGARGCHPDALGIVASPLDVHAPSNGVVALVALCGGLSQTVDRRGGIVVYLCRAYRVGGELLECLAPGAPSRVPRNALCGPGPDLSRMTASWQSGNGEG